MIMLNYEFYYSFSFYEGMNNSSFFLGGFFILFFSLMGFNHYGMG